MGSINETITDLNTLRYHAAQFNIQRRLSKGLQLGLAYTLAKGVGMTGYDVYTDMMGGADALRARYWGPTDVDRRHNLVVNYSYEIPNPTPGVSVLKYVLADWQVSGVTKYLSGAAVTPTCASNNAGIANTDPSLTGVTARCMLVGDPFSGFEEGSDPASAVHFDLAAFAMAQPFSPAVGNFGNTPVGILRNPSWSNWDVTLARRIPLHVSKAAHARVQFQAFNLFNQVQFTTLNAAYTFTCTNNAVINSAQTGRYTATTPPRQIGLTMRLDF
jgi:hypothetical protein